MKSEAETVMDMDTDKDKDGREHWHRTRTIIHVLKSKVALRTIAPKCSMLDLDFIYSICGNGISSGCRSFPGIPRNFANNSVELSENNK
jgi:hypothetical protein